ncbi:MAG: D-aminoacyl-tRNA deacylase [Acidobacteria bacterium]|nr:D-tyrosyl-tRNA(Tyr) deacylase [Acidobacteriota bacterium]MCY4598906.1 D-aminoacyl-tRNA deacylase [Acidobacteriota bacterium]
MRVVLQRVSSARVSVDGRECGRIARGLVALVGVGREDGPADVEYAAGKIRNLRLFEDDAGRLNRSLAEVGGELLVVSQFTLYGDCRRGRRPSFDKAAAPADALAIYEDFVAALRASGLTVRTGEFQAMMQVELVNDGPVTLLLDSRRSF